MNNFVVYYKIIPILNYLVTFLKLTKPRLLSVHKSRMSIFGHTASVRRHASTYDSRSKHTHKGSMSIFVIKLFIY
jgi:hypothetical protein